MGDLLVRGLGVVLAYVAAMITAVATLFVAFATWFATFGFNVVLASFTAFVSAHAVLPLLTVALLPGLVLATVGEIFAIRTFLYYVVAGGFAVAAIPILADIDGAARASFVSYKGIWIYLAIFGTAGFAGGAVYWLIAGRDVGP